MNKPILALTPRTIALLATTLTTATYSGNFGLGGSGFAYEGITIVDTVILVLVAMVGNTMPEEPVINTVWLFRRIAMALLICLPILLWMERRRTRQSESDSLLAYTATAAPATFAWYALTQPPDPGHSPKRTKRGAEDGEALRCRSCYRAPCAPRLPVFAQTFGGDAVASLPFWVCRFVP